MCGVNGVFSYRGGRIDLDELRRTREAQAARGPDGAGEYVSDDGGVGFGHRRLSIIDLSEAATQPMASDDGRLIVTFNGEIYNYRELRRELEAEGCVFRSHSDTETLLHLYRRRGLEMFAQLRGMYAFAISTPTSVRCCWRAIRSASSRCIIPTTARPCVSPRR